MVFSAVRSNKRGKVGFIENERRINVALTRAKHGLIIIGNSETLIHNEKWAYLISTLKIANSYAESLEVAKEMIIEKMKGEHMVDGHDYLGGAGCLDTQQTLKEESSSGDEGSAFDPLTDFM